MAIFAAISAGLGIMSALGIGKKEPKSPTLDLGKLRSDAVANGFNPLTVLRLTGGQGFQTGGSSGSDPLGQIGGIVGNFGNMMYDRQQTEAAESTRAGLMDAQRDLALAQVRAVGQPALRTASSGGPSRSAPETNTGLDRSQFFTGPANFEDQPWVPLFTATGQPIQWRQGLADRFDLGAYATVIIEDYEGIGGEILGEVQGLGLFGDVMFGTVELQRVGHVNGSVSDVISTTTLPVLGNGRQAQIDAAALRAAGLPTYSTDQVGSSGRLSRR
jgi:hypothetical protein